MAFDPTDGLPDDRSEDQKHQDFRLYYYRYTMLILERERVRRTYAPGGTAEVPTWKVETDRVRRPRPNAGGKVSRKRSRRVSAGIWAILRLYVPELIRDYPLGKEPRLACLNAGEYVRMIEKVIDMVCDPWASKVGDSVPWGSGMPRVPETPEHFEQICRRLRDEMPEATAKLFESCDLPAVSPAEKGWTGCQGGAPEETREQRGGDEEAPAGTRKTL